MMSPKLGTGPEVVNCPPYVREVDMFFVMIVVGHGACHPHISEQIPCEDANSGSDQLIVSKKMFGHRMLLID